jgi:16S rRNA (guanine966-N2)-methyltransferase
MLDRVVDSWQAVGFSRLLVAEHERTHALPAGGERWVFEHTDTAVTIYTR